jgi:phenylacetate-coenzyme A ligase PaaK-like adenylate-forming protein
MDGSRETAWQIIKVKGRNILPIDVEEIAAEFEDLENEFRIICQKLEMETLRLRIEHKTGVRDLRALKEKVEENAISQIGCGCRSRFSAQRYL